MGAHFAVMRCTALKGRKGIKFASGILCVSIILSTMLLKQHSVFDVATAIALGSVMYTFVYRREAALAAGKMRRGMKKRISM